jgi:hypothetical protein
MEIAPGSMLRLGIDWFGCSGEVAWLLCESGGHVYLADFGIVRLVDAARLTGQGTIGTVSYLSPEQGPR